MREARGLMCTIWQKVLADGRWQAPARTRFAPKHWLLCHMGMAKFKCKYKFAGSCAGFVRVRVSSVLSPHTAPLFFFLNNMPRERPRAPSALG